MLFALRYGGKITDMLGALFCAVIAWNMRHGVVIEWAPWVFWTALCLASAHFDWTGRMLRISYPGPHQKRMLSTIGVWFILHFGLQRR